MGLMIWDAVEISAYLDADMITEYAEWFSAVRPVSVSVDIEGDLVALNNALVEIGSVEANRIWFEFTDGITWIANAKQWELIRDGKAHLPSDAYCLRVYVAEIPLGEHQHEKYASAGYGVVSGAYFACEDCQALEDNLENSCETCDNSGPIWLTVYDATAREELDEALLDFGIEIPEWMPLVDS